MVTTKLAFGKVEENLNRRMDFHNEMFRSLHEGQMCLKQNLKMLIQNAGITPTTMSSEEGINKKSVGSSVRRG